MYRIFLLLTFSFSFLQAQNADQIIDRHFEATGGAEAWNRLSSVIIEGQVAIDVSSVVPLKIEHKRPYFKRVSFIVDGKEQLSEGYDGQNAFTYNEVDGKFRPLKDYKPDSFETDFLDYRKKGFKTEFMGTETRNGKEVYKIKLIKNTVIDYLFFDTKTYQLIGEENQYESVNYSDFRKVNGLTFAHRIESTPIGGKEYVIIFDRIVPNAAIDDARFKFK